MKIRSIAIAFAALCAASVPAAVFAYTLPAGYTELEYIQSAGGSVNSAYADTLYTPTSDSVGFYFDFTYRGQVGTSGTRIMGSSYRNGNNDCGLFLGGWSNTSRQGQFVFGSSASGTGSLGLAYDPGLVSGSRMQIEVKNRHFSSSQGRDFDLTKPTVFQANGNIYVGNVNMPTMSSGSSLCIYRFKIYDGDSVVSDFVPVQNPNGTAGLYDIVGSAGFRPSATATAFTAGGIKPEPEEEYPDCEPDVVVPSGMKRLDYIESTGTQYIDTGILPTLDMSFETVFACSSINYGRDLVGSVSKPYSNVGSQYSPLALFMCAGSYANGMLVACCSLSESRTGVEIAYDTSYHKYWCSVASQAIDAVTNVPSEVVTEYPAPPIAPNLSLQVFKGNCWWTNDHKMQEKVKYFKVWTNDVVVCRLVPVCRMNGDEFEYGMYDAVSGSFFANAGTGAFIGPYPDHVVVAGSPCSVGGEGVDFDVELGVAKVFRAPVESLPVTNAATRTILVECTGFTLALTNGVVVSGLATETNLVYSSELCGAVLTWNYRTEPQPIKEGDVDPIVADTAGLKIAVLGDSYSDFGGSRYSTRTSGYYPALDVLAEDDMWYEAAARRLGAQITYVQGVGGTTVGYMTKDSSFHSRVWGLGKDTSQGVEPDIVLVLGGANDQAQGAAQGEYLYDPSEWDNTTLRDFRPALASLLTRIRNFYPKARVYFVVNAPATSETDVYLQPEFIDSSTNVCRHLGVPYIELHDIERSNRHPTKAGMLAIGEQVAAGVAADFTNRATIVYSDAALFSNDASLDRRQVGNEFVYTATNVESDVLVFFKRQTKVRKMLLVGGGGAGGHTIGGGGGGGEVVEYGEEFVVPAWTRLRLCVGAGGGVAAACDGEKSSDKITCGANTWHSGFNGTDTSIDNVNGKNYFVRGGGGGGGWYTGDGVSFRVGAAGGNGGGGSNGRSGGSATSSGGHAGGKSNSPGAGGGGGMGAAGANGSSTASGAGGAGVVSSISGTALAYGGGGGGGAGNRATVAGAAGDASAGAGAGIGSGKGASGLDGRGGGGGGGSYASSVGYVGGRGGSGTVVLRIFQPELVGSFIVVR